MFTQFRFFDLMRVYVEVIVKYDIDGIMTPLTLFFEENKYEIQKVLDCRQSASLKSTGCGLRYEIQINGSRTFLFFERENKMDKFAKNRFFVEKKE